MVHNGGCTHAECNHGVMKPAFQKRGSTPLHGGASPSSACLHPSQLVPYLKYPTQCPAGIKWDTLGSMYVDVLVTTRRIRVVLAAASRCMWVRFCRTLKILSECCECCGEARSMSTLST
jgi:hypothetical protein